MSLIVTGAAEEMRLRAGTVNHRREGLPLARWVRPVTARLRRSQAGDPVTLAARAESAKVICDRIAASTAILDARRTTDSQMMITAKRIAALRNIACPADHLGLGMA